MIKLLLIGDRHNSQVVPKCRKDDFLKTCEDKDNEIINLAKTHEVDAIVHPGDFWTDSDRKLKNDFIAEVASKWDNIYVGTRKIPLIGIAGNHDLIGENEASLSVTTTGLLDSLGIFKLVSRSNPFVIEKDGKKVVITGTNYHKGMDKPENIGDYIVKEHLGDVHIHVVHGMLSPSNLGKLIRHTNIDNILDTKADITFCGHDHNGFGIINTHDKFFINPGAVVRLSANIKEINRTVGVALVTIDNDIKCEFIPLVSAPAGKAVIDREDIDKATKLEDFTTRLKDSVRSMDIGKGASLSDIIDNICSEKKIAPDMQAEIKTAIEQNITVKISSVPAPTGTNITKIHLVNFQSHEDTTLDLDKHFNVIVGESRQGKSSVLRAIRWVVENKPSGKSFIRTQADKAIVEITLENGTIIQRFISNKENGYKIFLPDGKIEEGNTKMVTRVQELMGYSNFKIDENTSIPLNILRQGDSWYLIGEKYTSTDRARILGALKDTNAADTTIKDLDHENFQIQTQIKKDEIELANSQLERDQTTEYIADRQKLLFVVEKAIIIENTDKYRVSLDDFNDKALLVDKIEMAFDESSISEKINQLKDLCKKLQAIRKYIAIYAEAKASLLAQDKVLSQLPDIDEIGAYVSQLKDTILRLEKINIMSDTVITQNNRAKVLSEEISALDRADPQILEDVKTKLSQWEKIRDCYFTCKKSTKTIIAADKFIASSSIVDTFTSQKYKLQSNIDHIQRVLTLITRTKSEKEILDKKNEAFEQADKNMDDAFNKKIEILSSAHVCPTCYSQLSESSIKELIPKIKNKE